MTAATVASASACPASPPSTVAGCSATSAGTAFATCFVDLISGSPARAHGGRRHCAAHPSRTKSDPETRPLRRRPRPRPGAPDPVPWSCRRPRGRSPPRRPLRHGSPRAPRHSSRTRPRTAARRHPAAARLHGRRYGRFRLFRCRIHIMPAVFGHSHHEPFCLASRAANARSCSIRAR